MSSVAEIDTATEPPTDTNAATDPWARDRAIAVFEGELAEVCGHLHGLHARLVAMVAEALEHGWWEQAGVKSPEHWLCWQTGLAPAHAKTVVAAARRRDELPETMAAFDAGELSLDQVAPIVALAPGWADGQVRELATTCTVSQLRTALRRYPFADRPVPDAGSAQPSPEAESTETDDEPHPDAPVPEPPAAPGEFVRLVCDDDGTWRLSGRLDPDHGLIVDAALREAADALFRDSGCVASGAEALVEMANRSLDAVSDRGRRDRYRVHLQLDERCSLTDPLGRALPDWVRDLVCCDPSLAVTWTRNRIPIATSPAGDEIPAAVRRYVLARDGGCRVPGCGARHRLEIHHVIHRSHGGCHDTWNLVALCPQHHRMHHRGELGIHGNADVESSHRDALAFTDARGSPIATNRLIQPPQGPPPAPAGHYQHPLGERLDLRWLHFQPPRNTGGAGGPDQAGPDQAGPDQA